jgi:N-acetylmuramoyl-L-alanine amidase
MKNKLNLLPLILLTLLALSIMPSLYAQNNIQLRVVRGKIDTVLTRVHYVVGVATPGSVITINNLPVKQYSTGSFGAELNLDEGPNTITVKATSGGYEEVETFWVYFKKPLIVSKEDQMEFYPKPLIKTKKGAYLNYGAGADRLGGAKINFLAEGIKMELMDSVNNLYKVRLSEQNYAFIPKQFTERVPFGVKPPFSLTGSWSVSNIGKADRVRVSLENRQPYTIYRELDPNKLVIDIYGAHCNSNWITQYLDLKAIEYVHLRQTSSDIFSVIIKLRDNFSWGYSVDYVGNSLDITIRHTPDAITVPSRASLKGLIIGVDAGHGGVASGAVSPSGIKEKDLNLTMSYMLKEELEKRGAKVVMSRTEDVDVAMQDRLDIFKRAGIDLMLSIHCNAGGNPLKPMGTSTYYRHIEYRTLAETILKRLLELNLPNFGLIGNFNFSLNSPTEFPTVLVETLFMSSLPDEEQLSDEKFLKEMMVKVAKGLEDYVKDVKKSLK